MNKSIKISGHDTPAILLEEHISIKKAIIGNEIIYVCKLPEEDEYLQIKSVKLNHGIKIVYDADKNDNGLMKVPTHAKDENLPCQYTITVGPAILFGESCNRYGGFRCKKRQNDKPSLVAPDVVCYFNNEGFLDRKDGPAIRKKNGEEHYFSRGSLITKEKFEEKRKNYIEVQKILEEMSAKLKDPVFVKKFMEELEKNKQEKYMNKNKFEEQYLNLLQNVLDNGEERSDRTGVGTKSLFAPDPIKIDLNEGFPILTTKKIAWQNAVKELIWFLSGSTNVNDLPKETQHWWTPWAKEDGSLGHVYGGLWRNWNFKVDQIESVINSIKENPNSRRHIVSTWHPGEVENQALPPCHGLIIQFYVSNMNTELSIQAYQRSADLAIGLPINFITYSLLLSLIAKICNLKPRFYSHVLGDAHIYSNHITNVKEQLKRNPKNMPNIVLLDPIEKIEDFSLDKILIENYDCHPVIKFPIAV